MSDLTEDEDLPPIQELPALHLVVSSVEDSLSVPAGWIPLLPWPVDPLQEGSWAGDWSPLADRIAIASPTQPIALECIHGCRGGTLHTRSVRYLLEEVPPQWERVAALVLERVEVSLLGDGQGNALWPTEWIHRWAEWISVLPDGVVPVVWMNMGGLSPAYALHLACADVPSGLLMALQGAPSLLQADLDWTVLGVDQASSRGCLATQHHGMEPAAQGKPPSHQVGVVLPPDRLRTLQDCEQILAAIEGCRQRGWGVRLFKEEQIHQSWHELEALLVLGDRLSSKGRRQCAGFLAAGGALLWMRESPGMEGSKPLGAVEMCTLCS